MDPVIPVYLIYGAVSIGLTVWLARTLYRNGDVFLIDVFEDRPHIAQAINRLLVVGFYMFNLGYALLILREPAVATAEQAFEVLVSKLGILLVSLGVIHFVNMLVFYKIRRRTQLDSAPPPVHPQVLLPPPPAVHPS